MGCKVTLKAVGNFVSLLKTVIYFPLLFFSFIKITKQCVLVWKFDDFHVYQRHPSEYHVQYHPYKSVCSRISAHSLVSRIVWKLDYLV
jgi:hypothetical protein